MTEPGGRTGVALDPDEERVAAALVARGSPGDTVITWGPRHWVGAFLLFMLVLVVIEALDRGLAGLSAWWGRGLWIRVAGAAGVATLSTWWGWRWVRGSPEERARKMVREWRQMVAPGWPLRTVMMGVWMGLIIAIPVGALMAWTFPDPGVTPGSRTVLFVGFLGMTLLWTIPMAFLIRLMAMTSFRKFLREVEGGSSGGPGAGLSPEGGGSRPGGVTP